MKTICSIFIFALFLFVPATLTWAFCPDMPNDNGNCDTLYAGILPDDQWIKPLMSPPFFARISFYVTHDNINPVDTIAAFLIPICYTHTNPAKYCSLTGYWNEILWNPTKLPRNIFRHLVTDGDTIHNWMMDRYEAGHGEQWNGIILDLNGINHFWLNLIPSGSEDTRFGSESRVLLATMTFKFEDTTTICVDPCFWPPGDYGIVFSRSDAVTYVPRHNMTYCASTKKVMYGDANTNGAIDIGDVIFLINYLYKNGSPPNPFWAGDCDCDDAIDVGEVIYLINYLFRNGPPPAISC